MKTLHCIMYVFFVIWVLDITEARDFTDIWRILPTDFGNAINNAWKVVLKAIKSPIRARRLGRNRRKKATKSTTMDILEFNPTSDYTTTILTDVPRRPTIPIITQPEWKSLLDWRILQRPNLGKLAQEFHNRGAPSMYGREINSYEGSTLKLTTNDEENFGSLYFV